MDLNQLRSCVTKLIAAIGASKNCAARRVMQSKGISEGVSRMPQRSRAARRWSSAKSVGMVEGLAAKTGGDPKPVDAAGGQSNRIITQTNPDGLQESDGFPAVGKARLPGRW